MRVAESLEVPDELERARAAGELVVFAGAGVSMGPPALLPSFQELARKIAERKILWDPTYSGTLDRYLGRAEAAGVDVQTRAREFLRGGGAHTPLHEHLLRLFSTADRVRLITTNFDRHFAAAAECVFPGASGPRYVGPALPPGRNFAGVAQLHGALDQEHTRLVLTDRDFADAYMADGWATRFLVRVFTDRTVLFVGYSVGDPLIQYLLHAIPPTGRWYGLWHEDELAQSTEHNIQPVTFRTSASGDRFGDLNDGMRRWGWYAAAPSSDHTRETERLIALGPPTSPTDVDYLRARLATDVGRLAFWGGARNETWLWWAASNGYLDGLTTPASMDTQIPGWAEWGVRNFMGGVAPPLVRLLQERPFTLHRWFAAALCRYLWVSKPWPADAAVRQILALLVTQASAAVSDVYDWQWLLKRLVEEQWWREAMVVLRFATQVRLEPVDEAFRIIRATQRTDEGDDAASELRSLSMRVATLIEPSRLNQFLDEHGIDVAREKPDEMLALAEQRIEDAYELLDLARGSDPTIDWLSYGRTAVAPSGQDTLAQSEDVLVEMARAGIDRLAVVAPARLDVFAKRGDQSSRALLRRLALYAYARRTTYNADTLLKRAIQRRWPQNFWLRPELYLLLDAHYAKASEPSRATFIAALQNDDAWSDVEDEFATRARYNLAQKLRRIAPDSESTREFAEAEHLAHDDWTEGDPDGYLSRVDFHWGGVAPSPIAAAQLVAWEPSDAVAHIRRALDDAIVVDNAQALLDAVQQATATAPMWGVEIIARTMGGDGALHRVASAALWGLRETPVPLEEKLALLRHIATDMWAQEIIGPIAAVLDRWSADLGVVSETQFLDGLDAAGDAVYARAGTERPNIEGHGWLEAAINHPAGQAAQLWWRVANARDWIDGQFVLSLDDAERARWRRVVEDGETTGSFARPILGMATDRLSGADLPWAAKAVFPAFDATRQVDRAAQLWDGRLMQSRWSWTTLEALRPYIGSLFDASASLVPFRSAQLGDWVAMLVAAPERSGITLDLLARFIDHATEDARVAFAREMPRHLASLAPEVRRRLWRGILSPYWRDRRTNIPRSLSASELREMIGWVSALPEVASEVLDALRASPGEQIENADHVIWEWTQDDSWVRAHPAEAAGIMAFLGERRCISSWHADDGVNVLSTCLDCGASPDAVRDAAEALVELGSVAARALVERLRKR